MTLVLIRLKLALIRNLVRGQSPFLGGAPALYGIPLLLGAAAGGFVALARSGPEGASAAVSFTIPSLLFLGWLIGPVVTLGLDATLDPARLVPFPLSTRQLTVGLFGASCLGAGALFTALTLAGVVVGSGVSGPMVALSVLAAATIAGICVATARAVAAAISAASRRVRDILLLVVPLLLLLPLLLPSLAGPGGAEPDAPDLSGVAAAGKVIATALPTGPGARSLVAAAEGRALPSLAWLGGSIGWLAVLLLLWSIALRRSLIVPMAAPASGGRDDRKAPTASLFPLPMRWLPRNRVGAVAAKELRVGLRDPRQRMALIGSAFGAVAFVLSAMAEPNSSSVLRACVIAFFVGANATNMYGFDGGSHWMNVAAGDDARSDLLGKSLARATIGALGALVMLVILAAATGGWSRSAQALALCVAGLGLGLGPAAWVSVIYPSPAPAKQRNVFANANTGQGMQVLLPILVISILGFGVLGALGWLMTSRSGVAGFAATVAALAIGPGAYVVGFGRAVARSQNRQPELLLTLSRP